MHPVVRKLLQTAEVRFVRVLWCDNANVIRAKAVHTSGVLEETFTGVGITVAQQAIPVMYDAVSPNSGLGPVGDALLVPDWSTLTVLPYAPRHARVMGDMMREGTPWSLCPRDFLKRMIREAAQAGYEVQAAFESEFYLLRPTATGFDPLEDSVFAATLAMDRACPVIDDLAEALIQQDIPVAIYYPESGPGQHELSIRYTNALEAADRQITFRETAHAIAHQHGLRVSFLPKVFENKAGSGCHLHLSLWKEGHNVFPDPHGEGGLSAIGRAFLAGILQHLPGLCALLAPSTNSYRRLKPRTWSGGFRCWGTDNREAALRVIRGSSQVGATQFEIKTADASANPYLACGAAIAAGLDGLRRNLDPGPSLDIDPGELTDAALAKKGIEPLPSDLDEAITFLEANDLLMDALGPDLARAYLAVRRIEWDVLRGYDFPSEVNLLLERY